MRVRVQQGDVDVTCIEEVCTWGNVSHAVKGREVSAGREVSTAWVKHRDWAVVCLARSAHAACKACGTSL